MKQPFYAAPNRHGSIALLAECPDAFAFIRYKDGAVSFESLYTVPELQAELAGISDGGPFHSRLSTGYSKGKRSPAGRDPVIQSHFLPQKLHDSVTFYP